MKRKKADIASFFRASGKKSAKAKNEGEMEKKQAESEDEEPPESSNLNGPPGLEPQVDARPQEQCILPQSTSAQRPSLVLQLFKLAVDGGPSFHVAQK
ncbi:unnamed protein product [Boreogadus saida]